MKFSKQLRLSAGSLAVGLVLSSVPAFAQDADDTVVIDEDGDVAVIDDNAILVTGTRLNVNPNLEGAAPVLSVGEEAIASTGTTRIEDLTNTLPQVFAGQAGEVSNGASGTSTLNLRGLGSVRTLVLIDGRRLPYGSSGISSANLDLVPTQLVERVDILTGGASAVYGSDAVAGVANFILKRDFEGVELDAFGAFQQTGNGNDFFNSVLEAANVARPGPVTDGAEYAFTGIVGANTADGRGNVTLYANYEVREQVTQNNRDFSACTIGTSTSSTSFGGAGCVGSANFRLFGSRSSTIVDPLGSPTNPIDPNIPLEDQSDETISFLFQNANGQLVEYVGGPAQTYNFGQRNFFQRPSERFSMYAKGHYELTDNIELFASASYTDNVSDAQIAETASFGIGAYQVNCGNPYLQGSAGTVRGQNINYYDLLGCSAQDVADDRIVSGVTASHRNVEGGPRNSRLENSAWRVVGGLRGDFGDGVWDWEAFGQYAETSDTSISTNDFVVANLQQSLLATTDEDGNVVCIDQSNGCVPYNPFQRNADGSSAITPDQYNFIQGVGIIVGETSQLVGGANIQGDLGEYGFRSPFSEEGIALLVGVEYREDRLRSTPDEISQVPGGGFTGVGGATLPVEGSVDVYEVYGELQIPLITDRPFFQELTLSGQYRYSDYSANGNGTTADFNTDAYGVSAVWVPIDDIKFRAQYQRSVRAPNVIELFTGQDIGLANLNLVQGLYDPCATTNPTASLSACQNTGVTANQYGTILDVISGQSGGIFGGNPQLRPESSDTYTAGVVLEPSFVPSLILSVDYFDITVNDYISAGIGAQTILDNCLATGDEAFCSLLQRDSGGSLNSGPGVGFTLTNVNIAQLTTSGLDIQASYDLPLFGNGFDISYAGTILFSNDFVPFPGAPAVDCVAALNNDCVVPVNPKYRHRVSVGFETDFGFEPQLIWRYYGGTDNEVGDSPQIDDRLDAVNYIDLSAFFELNDMVTLRGGVLNLLNEQPPVSASSGAPLGNGNTFPTLYDTARTIFAGVNLRF